MTMLALQKEIIFTKISGLLERFSQLILMSIGILVHELMGLLRIFLLLKPLMLWIRPLESTVSGLFYHKGNIANLSHLDDSVESLSCLHTMEHIGLGRYGDPIDPLGYLKGMNELQRVLKPRGKLYFSVPIGQERVEFNAHRAFNPMTILKTFSSLNLVEFVAVNAAGDLMSSVQPEDFKDVRYACGIFIFQKSSLNETSL